MRLLACLGLLMVAQPVAGWTAQSELAPGFTIFTKAGSRQPQFRLDTWRLQRKADRTSSTIELVVATADAKARVRIQPVLKHGSTVTLYSRSLCPKALAVANGSFYVRTGDKTDPLGLVRVGGRTIADPSQRRSGGFLAIDNGKARILPRAAASDALKATDAIESTPILVRNGNNDMRSDDRVRFDRVAIGTLASGKTALIGAFGEDQDSVSLYEFSLLARAAVAATGEKLQDLLAMDGGPSAHIYLPPANRLFGYRGPAYLPNAVCIEAG